MQGFENLSAFFGVVEDNNDPMKMGRVRARAFGFHSQNQQDIPVEDLPWASMVNGTYNAAFKPPPLGAWVFGVFMDGEDAQHPLLLGTISSMPTQFLNNYGPGSRPCDLYQPDMSRLARGEDIQGTNVLNRSIRSREPVPTSTGEDWETPKPAYNAQYTHNRVEETSSGHTIEYDDTPANERIAVFHTTGTGYEMDSQGNQVSEIRGSGYQIIDRNGYIFIKGRANISIGGDANILVENDANISVSGDCNTKVHGDSKMDVAGNFDLNVGQAFRVQAGKISLNSKEDSFDLKSSDKIRLEADGEFHAKGSEMFVSGDDKISLHSGGVLAADGTQVQLAGGLAGTASGASVDDLGAPIGSKSPIRRNYMDREPMHFDDIDDGSSLA